VNTTDDEKCNDDRICTAEVCDPDDPDAVMSGCVFTIDITIDTDICNLEICRTAGFWGTHPVIVDELLGFLKDIGYSMEVCGMPVENTLVNWESSAIEALCNHPRGDFLLITTRALTAAALNCSMSAGDPDCRDTSIEELWQHLNTACINRDFETMVELKPILDCWNNGGDLSMYDTYGCVTGLCGGIPDSFCRSDSDCGCESGDDCCVKFVDSCHEQPLVNDPFGFFFEPPGRAKPQKCHKSIKNECTLTYIDDCKFQ